MGTQNRSENEKKKNIEKLLLNFTSENYLKKCWKFCYRSRQYVITIVIIIKCELYTNLLRKILINFWYRLKQNAGCRMLDVSSSHLLQKFWNLFDLHLFYLVVNNAYPLWIGERRGKKIIFHTWNYSAHFLFVSVDILSAFFIFIIF